MCSCEPVKRKASAHAEPRKRDILFSYEGQRAQVADAVDNFLDRPFDVQRGFEIGTVHWVGTYLPMEQVGRQANKSRLRESPRHGALRRIDAAITVEQNQGRHRLVVQRAREKTVDNFVATLVSRV